MIQPTSHKAMCLHDMLLTFGQDPNLINIHKHKKIPFQTYTMRLWRQWWDANALSGQQCVMQYNILSILCMTSYLWVLQKSSRANTTIRFCLEWLWYNLIISRQHIALLTLRMCLFEWKNWVKFTVFIVIIKNLWPDAKGWEEVANNDPYYPDTLTPLIKDLSRWLIIYFFSKCKVT